MPDPASRGSWAALFHQTTDPVFLLNPRRRLRYVNRAFEALTRAPADAVVHEYCHPRKVQKDMPAGRRALLQTLAPPPAVKLGRIARKDLEDEAERLADLRGAAGLQLVVES